MAQLNLSLSGDRLKAVDAAFNYPVEAHRRKHGPFGYTDYESYREWLRDEFSYRCVFSLIRETWVGRAAAFDIDHLQPQAGHVHLVCDYDNLLYLSHRINLRKGKRPLPDPGKLALGKCLRVEPKGDRIGQITATNKDGQMIVDTLKLNNPDEVEDRLKWLEVLRAVAVTDEVRFRKLLGFPSDLADLSRRSRERNKRPEGISHSAYHLREVSRKLPEWY